MTERKVRLPTTLDDFDKLVDKVAKKYKLTDINHAAAYISGAIRKLPPDEMHTSMEYLGHSVLKSIADHVAKHKSNTLQHEHQINQLSDHLRQNPNDFEARDKLQAAANEGSPLAKRAMDEYLKATGETTTATA